MTLKRRVGIMLCLCDGVLHRTKKFAPDYRYTTALVGNWNADEVVVVDVTPPERREQNRPLFYEALRRYDATCFAPLVVGGGIRSVEDATQMIQLAADIVLIADRFLLGGLGHEIAHKLGRQALTAGIDYSGADRATVVARSRAAVERGEAGQILLSSIDRDGSLMGYDLAMVEAVCEAVDVPVMVAGGCGTWKHMADAFEAGASAACTSVIHHFTETSLAACKTWLAANCGADWRVRAAA